MTRLARRIDVRAAAPRVWRLLTDFPNMPSWFVGVRRVELLTPTLAAGSERRITLLTGSHRERIEPWEEGKRFGVTVLDPPRFARSWTAAISVEDAPAGARVLWTMTWEPRFGIAGRLFSEWLVRPLVGAALQWSLRRARRLLEAGR